MEQVSGNAPHPEVDPSQERYITITVNGKWYQIPTVVDGKQLTDEEAAQSAMRGKNWGRALESRPPQEYLNKRYPPKAIDTSVAMDRPEVTVQSGSSIRNLVEDSVALPLPPRGVDNLSEDPEQGNSIKRMVMGQAPIEDSTPQEGVSSIAAMVGVEPKPLPVSQYHKVLEESGTEKVSTTNDPFEAALMPIKEYWGIQKKHAKAGMESMSQGVDLIKDPGLGRKALGAGLTVLGALQYVSAPITAAEQALVGDPIRRVGGPELAAQSAEMGLDFAAFGGLRSVHNLINNTVRELGVATGKSQFSTLNKLGTILESLAPSEGTRAVQDTLRGEGAANVLKELTRRWDPENPLPPRLVAKVVNDALPPQQKFGSWWGNMWEIIDLGVSKRFIGTKEGKKSISEIMQPAVERLEKSGLDRPFRLASAKRQLAMRAGEDLGKELQGLSPVERLDVIRGLKDEVPTTLEGKRVVQKFRNQVKDYNFGAEYRKHFNNNLQKHLGDKEWKELDDPILRPYVDDLLSKLEGSFKGVTKPNEIMASMLKVIAHPNTPDNTRAILGTLYNLPASTPLAVAEAAKQSSRAVTIAGLARRGAIQDAQVGKDWIQITEKNLPKTAVSGLRGKWVPRDVWLEMKAEEDVAKFSHQLLNKWFMSPWKTSKVVLRPATHARNIMSNMILNDMGGLPFYRIDMYKRAYDEIRGGGKAYKEFRNLTGSGGTFSANDIAQVGEGLSLKKVGGKWERASLPERALTYFDKMVAKPRELYNAEEQLFKVAKFIHNKEKGMDKYDAAIDAMKWTFNYGEVTRATAMVRANVMPFFTYQSKVLPLMAKVAKEHPMRLGKWFSAFAGLQYAGMSAAGIGEQEYQKLQKILPEYIADSQYLLMPFRDNNGRLQMLNLTYMIPGFGDINEFASNPVSTVLANPMWSIAEGLRSGKNFNGAPLWYEWEDPGTKMAKGADFVWKQVMPSWAGVPGTKYLSGQDNLWDQVNQWYENSPDALTAGQIIGSQLGFKVRPIDPGKLARTQEALFKVRMSEIQRNMVKEIQAAGKRGKGGPEIKELAQNFQMLRQKLIQGRSPDWGPSAQISKLVQ